jgi:hypothetical protein
VWTMSWEENRSGHETEWLIKSRNDRVVYFF